MLKLIVTSSLITSTILPNHAVCLRHTPGFVNNGRSPRVVTQLVTPSIQSYTNHTRKCVRSRSRTHGKISQHNSRHKLKIIQALYYKPGASRARIHKLENTRVSGSNNI